MLGSHAYVEEVRELGDVKKWEQWKRNGAEEVQDPKNAGERQAGDVKGGQKKKNKQSRNHEAR